MYVFSVEINIYDNRVDNYDVHIIMLATSSRTYYFTGSK